MTVLCQTHGMHYLHGGKCFLHIYCIAYSIILSQASKMMMNIRVSS